MKAFWVLGIDRTVQNVVGAQEYGLYFSLFSFSVLFNILLDFGITNYNNRRIATTPSDLPAMLGNIFIIRFLFALIYSLVTIVFARTLGYGPRQMGVLYVLMVNQFIVTFIIYLRSNITALHLFSLDSIISVMDRFLMIIICGLLLWGNITKSLFEIEWFVYSQTAAYGFTLVAAMLIVIYKGKIQRFVINLKQVRRIIRESFPYALLALFITIYWRSDSVMIERMMPDGLINAGIYAQAFRLLDAVAMIPFLFSVILLPMLTRLLSKGESPSSLLRFSTFLLLIPASVTTAFSILYSSDIMELLYRGHVAESSGIFAILMAGYLPVSFIYIYSTFITAMGKMRILNIIALAGMTLNILLNFILIPTLGLKGAAITSVGTQFILAVLYGTIVVRRKYIERKRSNFLQPGMYLLFMFLLSVGLKIFSLPLLPGGLIIMLAGIVLPLLLRAISTRDFLFIFD